jgi:hypothetical protein
VRANAEKTVIDEPAVELRPIEFVTENGFSIIRPWEIDGKPPDGSSFSFLVRDPAGWDQSVTVTVSIRALEQLSLRLRCHLDSCTSFLIACAERHLADFLGENGRCPQENKLVVDCLDPQELMLAIRWNSPADAWAPK